MGLVATMPLIAYGYSYRPMTDTNLQQELDTIVLKIILAQDVGTIANIVQAASELPGSMAARLAMGYYEITNTDPGAEDDVIRLPHDDDE